MIGRALAFCFVLSLTSAAAYAHQGPATSDGATSGPTPQSALSAERAINQALLTSDADALERLLAKDWVVVSGFGGIAQRNDFITYVRAGSFTRKTMVESEPRVRVYGDTAVVTTHLDAVGRSLVQDKGGRPVSHCFAVRERQTDVLVWANGDWKSVLLHETVIPDTLHVKVVPAKQPSCA